MNADADTQSPSSKAPMNLNRAAFVIVLGILAALSAMPVVSPWSILLLAAAAILVDQAIAFSVRCLNRVSGNCRRALLRDAIRTSAPAALNLQATELADNVSRLRDRERQFAADFDMRRCSEADVVRAASLRLQAEIALIRLQQMPRSLSETVGMGE